MARVLVLGGAGFVGYHLARRLAEDPTNRITLVDDLSRGRMDGDLAALLARPGVELVRADLTERASLAALPRAWDEVYMLAAVVGVRHAMQDPLRVVRVNTLATLNVLDWATPAVGALFFASTSETYAGAVSLGQVPVPTPETVPLTVADVHNPRFAYAASKILGEAATIHAGTSKGLRVVIGRLHNVYGPRMGRRHVIPEFIERALRREDPFDLFGGHETRAFCYVDDAIEATCRVAATPACAEAVVHIGNPHEEIRIDDLARLVMELVGWRAELRERGSRSGSVSRRCPDISRLKALTGFEPAVSLREGLARTVAWYTKAPDAVPAGRQAGSRA